MVQLLQWGFTTFSNLSTFRENANNEESDQTGLVVGGGG